MGYLASTSDTSAIADYNVLLGQGNVIRPRRIESDEERNLFDIYQHLWFTNTHASQLFYARVPFQL